MGLRPSHYDLEAWKEAMRLAREVYAITSSFPDSEKFGLALQLRRSAVSIPSNLAEGLARGSKPELRRFLLIARGSLMELDTQIWLAREIGLMQPLSEISQRIERVFRLLSGLIVSSKAAKGRGRAESAADGD